MTVFNYSDYYTKFSFEKFMKINFFTMEAANELEKPKKAYDNQNHFIGPIVYNNDLPDLAVDGKFLPCGRDILDYTDNPVSFPDLEGRYNHHLKGIQTLFDLDLVNLDIYDQPPDPSAKMDSRDVALLNDIEALQCHNPKPRTAASEHPRAQEFQLMFAKERSHITRPLAGLQRVAPGPKPQQVEPISLDRQKHLINQTFKSIKLPLGSHPTKPGSKAKPIAVMPIYPNTELQEFEFVQVQFDIPPVDIPNSLIKDFGNYLVNFNVQENRNSDPNRNYKYYLSDQRYKEERTAESADRGGRFMLCEKEGIFYYIPVDRYIKLRRERSRTQALTNKCLLQVKRTPLPTENDSNKRKEAA